MEPMIQLFTTSETIKEDNSLFNFIFLVSCKYPEIAKLIFDFSCFKKKIFSEKKMNEQDEKKNVKKNFFHVQKLLFDFCFCCHKLLENHEEEKENLKKGIEKLVSDFKLKNLFYILNFLEGLEVLFDHSDNFSVKSIFDPIAKNLDKQVTILIQKHTKEDQNNQKNLVGQNDLIDSNDPPSLPNQDDKTLQLLTKIKQTLKNVSSSNTKKKD